MNEFQFFPELLERRMEAIAALTDAGYEWLTDYASVNPMHDIYGIEVCGINNEQKAEALLEVLKQRFPQWPHFRIFDYFLGPEPGWWLFIHREPERDYETWKCWD